MIYNVQGPIADVAGFESLVLFRLIGSHRSIKKVKDVGMPLFRYEDEQVHIPNKRGKAMKEG